VREHEIFELNETELNVTVGETGGSAIASPSKDRSRGLLWVSEVEELLGLCARVGVR